MNNTFGAGYKKHLKVVGGFVALALMLSACGSGQSQGDALSDANSESGKDSQSGELLEAVSENEWVQACLDHTPDTTQEFGKAYEEVIKEVCQIADPETLNSNATLSPNVSEEDANRYLAAEAFHESYWSNYMDSSFPKKKRIIFNESDGDWWAEQQIANIKSPDLAWFNSNSEGGHCRVDATIFCPMNFEPENTISGDAVEFRIIGSKMSWQDWQLTNSAHETVHLYQDSHGQSHWSFWYIEGQATFFELAMARLLFDSEKIRTLVLFKSRIEQDSLTFLPTSPAAVAQYFNDCENSQSGGCGQFRYGVGSMFHEKLVIDYGLERYFEWQTQLNEQMLKGNPANFSPEDQTKVIVQFAEIFEAYFGISLEEFEDDVMANYLYDYFSKNFG